MLTVIVSKISVQSISKNLYGILYYDFRVAFLSDSFKLYERCILYRFENHIRVKELPFLCCHKFFLLKQQNEDLNRMSRYIMH